MDDILSPSAGGSIPAATERAPIAAAELDGFTSKLNTISERLSVIFNVDARSIDARLGAVESANDESYALKLELVERGIEEGWGEATKFATKNWPDHFAEQESARRYDETLQRLDRQIA